MEIKVKGRNGLKFSGWGGGVKDERWATAGLKIVSRM